MNYEIGKKGGVLGELISSKENLVPGNIYMSGSHLLFTPIPPKGLEQLRLVPTAEPQPGDITVQGLAYKEDEEWRPFFSYLVVGQTARLATPSNGTLAELLKDIFRKNETFIQGSGVLGIKNFIDGLKSVGVSAQELKKLKQILKVWSQEFGKIAE